MLYGLERFDQYTYGRKVIVQNDHKPLAAILSKPQQSTETLTRYHDETFLDMTLNSDSWKEYI